MLVPALARAQSEAAGAGGGASAGAGAATSGDGGAAAAPGGFLRSPGFDAYGQPLAPSAPSFSALEAFGFPSSPGTGQVSGRPFNWNASLGGQVRATDNLLFSPTNRQSDVGLTLLPTLSASADSAYLRGGIYYAPILSYYVNTPSQNRVLNFLTANARATLLEDKVFVQLNGFGTVNATSGGFAPVGTPLVGNNNNVQSYAFQVAPYYVQRFGSLATMNMGYAYRWRDQAGSSAYAPGSNTPFFTSTTAQGNQGWLVLRSGEDLGKLLMSVRLIGTVFTGNGVYNDAHQYTGSFQAAYAITRWLSLLGEIGYEDARYSGINPYVVKQMTWGAGARIVPDENSAIIAAVRQRDGFVSPFADVAIQLGSRTRLHGYYREYLTTSGVQQLDLLNAITYDALGNPIDRFAGAPIVIPFAGTPFGAMGGALDGGIASQVPAGLGYGGSFLSTQNALMRMKTGTASISQIWERDALTLSYFYQDTNPVAVARGTTAYAQSGNNFGITYSHLLTENTSLSVYGSYGRFNTSAYGNSNTWTGRVLVAHRFTESVFGSLQYVYTNRGNYAFTTGNTNATQNLVLATLRKVF